MIHRFLKYFAPLALSALSVQGLAMAQGTDFNNFSPHSLGLNFINLEDGDVLDSSQFLFSWYADQSKNSVPVFQYDPVPTGVTVEEPGSSLTQSHLNIGYGINSWISVGLGVGFVHSLNVDDSPYLTSYAEEGLSHVNIQLKTRILNTSKNKMALSLDYTHLNNTSNAYVGADGGSPISLKMSYSYVSALIYALNLGYRMRQPGSEVDRSGVTPLKDQGTIAFGITKPWASFSLGFEVFGAFPFGDHTSPVDREMAHMEGLLFGKYHFNSQAAVTLGFGSGLIQGLATPESRVLLGLSWNFGGDTKEETVDPADSTPPPPIAKSEPEPEPDPEPVIEKLAIVVLFPFKETEPRADSLVHLDAILENIQSRTIISIQLVGHSDKQGPEAYNQKLSELRAENLKRRILNRSSLKPDQIDVIGVGSTELVGDMKSQEGRAQNRRVEVVLKFYPR